MSRQRDIVVAFCLAIAAHYLAAVCADALYALRPREIEPVFQAGESSVRLTVLPPSRPPKEPPKEYKVAAQPLPRVVVQEEQPRVVQNVAPDPEPPKQPEIVPDVQSTAERPQVRDAVDGDNLPKGVESSRIAIASIRPYYPFGSRLRGEEGVARIRTLVDASGGVESAEILSASGYPGLDRAALDAVRKARFARPPANGGAAAETIVSFRFKLVD